MRPMDVENFRKNLATAIEALGLKKSAVAIAAKVSRSYLDDVIKGDVAPTLPMCERLAKAVGFTLIALLDDAEKFSAALLTTVR
jgi:ribosome-binding protein aMBF1 (putative translation factor)